MSRSEERTDIRIDIDRLKRCGHPEVVYAPHKTPEQIVAAMERLYDAHGLALATRCSLEGAADVARLRLDIRYEPISRTLLLGTPVESKSSQTIGVVSAGTSDLPVAEEAAVVLETFGYRVERICDVGVAGLHRLIERLDEIRACDATIVVAGMEGALAGVLGGLLRGAVIAVPTSTGYGVAAGGRTALEGMLSSCSAGITVTNIDNGFGAAIAIMRIFDSQNFNLR